MILAFGKALRNLRLSRGMSQGQLAKKIGISVSMIGLYENSSRMPSFETFINISRTFDVSADFLLGLEDSGRSPFDLEGLTDGQMQTIFSIIGEYQKANECRE